MSDLDGGQTGGWLILTSPLIVTFLGRRNPMVANLGLAGFVLFLLVHGLAVLTPAKLNTLRDHFLGVHHHNFLEMG